MSEKYAIEESWLKKRYVDELASVKSIAEEVGCSTHNIKKWLKVWRIYRGQAAKIGKPTWNSGLSKETDERMAKLARERIGHGNPMFDKEPWNKGVSQDDDARVKKSVGAAFDGYMSKLDETKKKMSKAKTGLRGEQTNNWKGGVYLRGGAGYVMIRVGGKKVYLHRWIAESCLGRKLLTNEEVHHINMNRLDNRPSNLLVMKAADHTRLHKEMKTNETLDQIEWLLKNNIWFEEITGEYKNT